MYLLCSLDAPLNAVACTGVDKCESGTHKCHAQAQCTNTIGGYTCACKSGYSGNGTACADIDECQENSHNCHAEAVCVNNAGDYTCSCKSGYAGNGTVCVDKNLSVRGIISKRMKIKHYS